MVKKASKTTTQKPKHEDEPEGPEVENGDEHEEDEDEESEGAPAKAPASPDEEGKDAGEAANPPAASLHSVTIEGEGSIPLVIEGAFTRLQRGEPVKVTDAQLAALKEAGEKVKKS